MQGLTPANPSVGRHPELRRVLTLRELVLYGLGIIVGAGIYVALGTVINHAGNAAPLSFLLAGVAAALTGLCYAEMASRFPEAAGAVSYVQRGFDSKPLAQVTGAAMVSAVTIAAAAIAHGTAQYLAVLVPLPTPLLLAALISIATAIAMVGVRESVVVAATLGVIEIGGLIAVTFAGFVAAPEFALTRLASGGLSWLGVVAGSYIAFFAFIGFETIANMAEETKDARRNIPRGILWAVALSVVLYVTVALAVVLSGVNAENPMIALFEGRAAVLFSSLGSIAVANGVLIEIVMLARLFYGMARKEQLPSILAAVDPRTRTPIFATACAGALVLAAALFLPFESLLVLANGLTLAVFALVGAALWKVKTKYAHAPEHFVAPDWVPPAAVVIAVALIVVGVAT